MARGKRFILSDIATSISLDPTRPSKWRRRVEFCDALADAILREHRHLSAAARSAMYHLAISGNLAAFDRIREVERDIEALRRPTDGGVVMDPAAQLGGVHVHVHGSPERQPFATLPPPLELPASSAAPTSAPVK